MTPAIRGGDGSGQGRGSTGDCASSADDIDAAAGATNTVIAQRLGFGSQHKVGRWRKCFASGRVDGFFDEPRPGGPRTIGDDEIAETILRTLETMPLMRRIEACASWPRRPGSCP